MASSKKQSDEAAVTPDENATPEVTDETAAQNDESTAGTPENAAGGDEGQDATPEAENAPESVEEVETVEEVREPLSGVELDEHIDTIISSATRDAIRQELAASGESPTLDGLRENNA